MRNEKITDEQKLQARLERYEIDNHLARGFYGPEQRKWLISIFCATYNMNYEGGLSHLTVASDEKLAEYINNIPAKFLP
jgi:hypothetical protein